MKKLEIQEYDVIVVGAGPGGAWAGLELAQKGYKTVILEKESLSPHGRYKACGGAMAWELVEEINYPASEIAREIQFLELHHVDGPTFHKEGRGAVVWRSVFDKYLVDQAVAAGCILEDNAPLISFSEQDTTEGKIYVVSTPSKTFSARFLIAADGVSSPSLKQAGFPRFTSDDLCLTITREVRVGAPRIKEVLGEDRVHLFFGVENLVAMGYTWLFPKEDTISVGWGNLLSRIGNARREYEKFLALPMVKEALKNGEVVREKAHMIPVGFRKTIGRDQILGVGDSVGTVDPISGKGIPYAMMAGGLAARAIKYVDKKNKPELLVKKYTTSLESKFGGILRQKKAMRERIFVSDDSVKQYLGLWENHRSSEILLKKLF